MKRLVSFFEIPAGDFQRAVKFYETVLNVKLAVYECETEKMAFFPEEDGKPTGAISYTYDGGFTPSDRGVLISLYVDNMEATLQRVVENGGVITREKTAILEDGAGYFSTIKDSEGNIMGFYSES